MTKKIVLLPGDGIGAEVIDSAKQVLEAIAEEYNHTFSYETHAIGGSAIDEHGTPLPDETTAACKSADAVLLGAVGGPKWDQNPSHLRPEKGLLGIRKALDLFANLRPIQGFDNLLHASPLKEEVVKGSDLLIVRELTGGLYFGTPSERRNNGHSVVDTLAYERAEIERIVDKAFQAASIRRKHLTSVDKANVLESSKLWREVVEEKKENYPDITVEHMLVDAAAMRLITNPSYFDVIVTENMFGDILSDEASVLTGSLGMLPSASLREDSFGLYEPVHGSAPDIAGQGIANPLAMILSAALLLRHSFNLDNEARIVESAVQNVLEQGYHTGDLNIIDGQKVGTEKMTERVVDYIKSNSATNSIMSCYA
ncbi:3-isopropylmalate dehydrogenase [Salipaludibacillus agaradhaerens]|uniref:3-isopropylmalate dehydrogenase n=1 Tax=Salipaludibacillus agaradhaerens TaxID=76935 RepID=UPI002151F633|nr:3-isopropylmalate dehydrogenase [Salipaludibacillus agaradhaerens]MCR6106088.1 3-isopropylmalate dehydrogenase [Salipaludibacillus agaradhaerens]MCR6118121.1 3-isopropylmalate dehydrogenase [Salipaludibacillus agaradhaerens]UJW57247.1 3-isopropylmalate dehydrogenase [Bacillus sp. A116_S68]